MQLYSVLWAPCGEMLSVVSELLIAHVDLTVVNLSRYVSGSVRRNITRNVAANILRFNKLMVMMI